jgi:uncharacterized OB-fold protein
MSERSEGGDFRVERDEASAVFFDAAAGGELLVRHCPVCGRLFPPSQRECTDGDALAWTPVAGTATLVTWAVDDGTSTAPELADAAADGEVIGIVELTEGLWLNAALPGVDPAGLHEGQALRVEFLRLGGGEPVPAFVPA